MIEKNATETRILWDDFANGFSVGSSESKWFYFKLGSFVGDDGIVSKTESGIQVVPRGKNPKTGEPAFCHSLAQDKSNAETPGALDHVKWLVYMNHTASSGCAGFDVIPNKTLTFETIMRGKSFGIQNHPFGKAVKDANSDLRLASSTMVCADFETMMVFDMFITNDTIYAFYERLPFARKTLGNYAAFSYQIPVAKRKSDDIHRLGISYNKESNTVRWFVDGQEVFCVENVGKKIDRKYMTLNLGGEEQVVSLKQIDAGIGLFTLLDATQPTGTALVKLSGLPGNFDPSRGEPEIPTFVDSESKEFSRLFGQGAELICNKYVVSYK